MEKAQTFLIVMLSATEFRWEVTIFFLETSEIAYPSLKRFQRNYRSEGGEQSESVPFHRVQL